MKTRRLTRLQERERIRKEQKSMTQDWKAYFSIPNMQKDVLFMPFRYYAYLMTMQRMGFMSNILLLNVMLRYGGVLTMLLNVFITILLLFPSMVLLIFMGFYNRKGMILLWDCIPVFKGIGYSAGLWCLARQIMDIAYCSISLLYIPKLFYSRLPWRYCNFTEASKQCWPMDDIIPEYIDCRLYNISLSTLEYFNYHIRGIRRDRSDLSLGIPNFGWSMCSFVTWFIVFVAMSLGFRKFVKPLYKFHLYTTTVYFFLFFYIIITSGKSTQNIVYRESSELFQRKLWTDIFSISLDPLVPGVTIYTSCFHPPDQTPYVTTIILFIINIALSFVLMIWESNVISITMNNYHMKYLSCVKLVGTDIVYGLTPDILSRMYFNRIYLFFWFTYTYIDGLASTIIVYTSVYNSFARKSPFVNKNRISGCALICLMAAISTLLLMTPASKATSMAFLYYIIHLDRAVLVAICMIVIPSIYQLKTVIVDFQFKCKEKPNNFLIQFWKLSPYFQLFVSVHIISSIMMFKVRNYTFKYVSLITAFVIVLPIFCTMLYLYCKNLKMQRLNRLVRPAPEWGPLRVSDREKRLLFIPHRESGYKKITLDCKHTCLLYSKKYAEEKENQHKKKMMLLESIRKEQEHESINENIQQ